MNEIWSFNRSGAIRVALTEVLTVVKTRSAVFQSLGRDSGRSDGHRHHRQLRHKSVSIARARFGSL